MHVITFIKKSKDLKKNKYNFSGGSRDKAKISASSDGSRKKGKAPVPPKVPNVKVEPKVRNNFATT